MSVVVELDYDTTAAEQKLDEIEQRKADAQVAVNTVISGAKSAYMATVNIVKAAGGTVGVLFQSIITVGFSAVTLLSSIASGLMATPGGQIQAGIMFLNIGLAIKAIIASQMDQAKTAGQLASAQMALHGISNLISSFSI